MKDKPYEIGDGERKMECERRTEYNRMKERGTGAGVVGERGKRMGERGNGKWETRDTRGVATRSFRSDAKCRSIVAFGKGLAQSLPGVEEWLEVGDGRGTRRKGQWVVERIELSRMSANV